MVGSSFSFDGLGKQPIWHITMPFEEGESILLIETHTLGRFQNIYSGYDQHSRQWNK